MRKELLEEQWLRLSGEKPEGGIHSIRISAACIPNLYLGLDKSGYKNLILEIPKSLQFRFKPVIKENLSIDFFNESHHIVLKLTKHAFEDLFNDLILSLYGKICDMSDPKGYAEEFIHAFYRWNGFFSGMNSQNLTDEIVKGLFGEMILLKQQMEASESWHIDSILDSWKGPYDARHDFESDEKCIEVKTIEHTKTLVKISSEFQMDLIPDKPLELCIVFLENGGLEGKTVSALISAIREIIYRNGGDIGIFVAALSRKGIFGTVLPEYDHLKFNPIKLSFYDCAAEIFPKLTPSNLADGIFDVSYSIRLSQLESCKLSENAISWK